MNISFRTNFLGRALGAALLLSAAFTAWGVSVTLDDGTNTITCTLSTGGSIRSTGDITTNVVSGCIPTATTGGGGGGTGPFTLTVSRGGTGTGTVTSNDSLINCGGDCGDSSYASGASVILTATAASGSTFAGWSGGGCTGTGACTLSVTANVSVTATFTLDAVAGACGALPSNVTVVDTGNLNLAWAQQFFYPLPQTIMAFKVTAPLAFTGRNTVTATKTSAATRSKLLVISTCPGVLTPVNNQTICSAASLESTQISMSANSADPSYYCHLTPGAVYYVNAVSKVKVTDTGYTCTSTTNCSFSGVRSSSF